MTVWVGLFSQAGRGSYDVSVTARPERVAFAEDLPFPSAEVRSDCAGEGADLWLELAEAGASSTTRSPRMPS